jgi:hypothetical protein
MRSYGYFLQFLYFLKVKIIKEDNIKVMGPQNIQITKFEFDKGILFAVVSSISSVKLLIIISFILNLNF